MKKKEKLIGAAVFLVIVMLIFIGILQSRKPTALSEDEIKMIFSEQEGMKINDPNIIMIEDGEKEVNNEVVGNIVVEIKGEVNNPNVYTIKEGSRINDLINLAGGLTNEADVTNINRATALEDGSCVIIGNINDKNNEEAIKESAVMVSNNGENSKDEKININKADKNKLMSLTGVGEVKADSIISYREKNGGFKSIEELAKVDGIGVKTVEKLKDKITVK